MRGIVLKKNIFNRSNDNLDIKYAAIKKLDLIDNYDELEDRTKRLIDRRWKHINSMHI